MNEIETIEPIVFIVESPSFDDYMEKRNEGKALSDALGLMGVESLYFPVFTEEGFDFVLDKIVQYYNNFTGESFIHLKIPVLHISAHGNQNCFALTNNKQINWNLFRDKLIPVNELCKDLLFVSMSVCEGYNAVNAARTLNASLPYLLLAGPTQKIKWGDSLLGFLVFYSNFNLLLESDGFQKMKMRLNQSIGADNMFDIALAEDIKKKFQQTIHSFFDKYLRK